MKAIEFVTTPTNGFIRLPESLNKIDQNTKVKVIILFNEKKKRGVTGDKKNLLANLIETPLKIKNFKPLTRKEIYE